MHLIDEQWLKAPFFGSRRMAKNLRREGYNVSRKRVRRLMRKMGLEAVYPRPRTSKPQPVHRVYPYLLRGMIIDRPNQVWSGDITFLPMRRGLGTWIGFYNSARPHSSLDDRTPDEAYFGSLSKAA
jgi:putative transposase